MRIGVISSGSPDYLIDIVTDGLIRLFGRQNISLDYNSRGGWGGAYFHLMQGFQGPEPFDIAEANVLITSVRSVPKLTAWAKLTGWCRPIVLLDGEDMSGPPSELPKGVRVIFKREYLKGVAYPAYVKPLPFAAIPEPVVDGVEVTRKVFYSGHLTHHFRKEVANALAEMGFKEADNQPKTSYNRCLMESLVGVAVRGNGWDTYRYWEIPYFGAALLSQRPGIVIPGEFENGREAIYYDSIADFKIKLAAMIENESSTMEIARAGRAAIMERHLSVHRAKTVLEAIS